MNPCTSPSRRPRPLRTAQPNGHRRGMTHRNTLVEAHRHLVPPLARHYWRRCEEPLDDLIQVGLLGLIRAAELFRSSHQTPFDAFARPHIRGAILHYLRDEAHAVRLPRRQSELQGKLRRVEAELACRCLTPSGREAEICRRLQITREQWRLLRRHRQLCRPTPLEPDVIDQLAPPVEDLPQTPLEHPTGVDLLLSALEPRTQRVLRLVVIQGWSYRRTAAALEVSAMTVQRCLERGLAALRETLSAAAPADARGTTAPSPGRRIGRAPSAAQGWPSRHSPPPAASPAHRAKT